MVKFSVTIHNRALRKLKVNEFPKLPPVVYASSEVEECRCCFIYRPDILCGDKILQGKYAKI
jgi:hypothetical protein